MVGNNRKHDNQHTHDNGTSFTLPKESPASEYWEGKKVILRKLFVIIENQNCKNRMNEIRLFHYPMKYGNERNLQRTNKGIRNVHTHTHIRTHTYSHIFFCPFLSHFHHKCILPKHALVQRPVGRSHAVLQIIVKHDEHMWRRIVKMRRYLHSTFEWAGE